MRTSGKKISSTAGAAVGARPHLGGVVHGRRWTPGRDDRADRHPQRPRRLHRRAGVDRQRLHLSFAVLLMTARGARRQVRPAAAVHRRAGAVHPASAACALAPEHRLADRRAGRAGRGRGDGHAARHGAAERRLPAAAAGPGARAVQRRDRPGHLGGPMVGGAVVQGLAWQWIFWLNVPIGLLLIPLVAARIDESFGPRAGSTRRRAAGDRRRARAWSGAWSAATPPAGGARRSCRWPPAPSCAARSWPGSCGAAQPMLPMRFFRSRAFSAGNAAGFLLFAAVFGAVFFFAQFLQVAPATGRSAPGCGCCPGRRRCSGRARRRLPG